MNKLWLVTKREYTYNLMRKSFIFTAFVMPVLIMGGMYVVIWFASRSASESSLEDYEAVGYVDEVGFLDNVTDSTYDRFIPYENENAVRAAFDSGELESYFVVKADYLQTGEVTYYGEKGASLALADEIDDFLVEGVTTLTSTDVPVERLRQPVNSQVYILGEEESLDEDALIGRFVLPIIFAILFIFTVLTTSQFLMSGVVEEKENRIMEILVTSVRPRELLIGKVLGLGALALTQMVFWFAASIILAAVTGRLEFLSELNFKPTEILLMVTYFVLSFLLFAGIMVGIGASVTAEQESRQAATIFVLMSISPTWFIGLFIDNPTNAVATFFSLFPFTAPITNLFLIATGDAREWQIALSLTILVVSIVATMWIAVRLFHAGMLMYGQRLGLRQVRRAVLGGR